LLPTGKKLLPNVRFRWEADIPIKQKPRLEAPEEVVIVREELLNDDNST